MQRSHRVLVAIVILLTGTGAFIFAGGKVAGCLGPLGVTPIQCAKVTGIIPTIGLGLPVLAATAALAVLILVPTPPGRRRESALAALLGAGVAALAVVMSWERTWTGVDSAGRTISIDRPVDLAVVATAAVLAATAAGLASAFVGQPRRFHPRTFRSQS